MEHRNNSTLHTPSNIGWWLIIPMYSYSLDPSWTISKLLKKNILQATPCTELENAVKLFHAKKELLDKLPKGRTGQKNPRLYKARKNHIAVVGSRGARQRANGKCPKGRIMAHRNSSYHSSYI